MLLAADRLPLGVIFVEAMGAVQLLLQALHAQ